jgi:hypothetical protein
MLCLVSLSRYGQRSDHRLLELQIQVQIGHPKKSGNNGGPKKKNGERPVDHKLCPNISESSKRVAADTIVT